MVKFHKVEIHGEEIIGIKTEKIRVPIKELSDYVLEHGFKHDGVWYFRKSWMRQNSFNLFREAGLIEKVGTIKFLRNSDIKVPDAFLYNTGRGKPQIYRVTDDKINNLNLEEI